MSQRAPEALNSPIRVQRSRATPRNVACVTQGLSRVALGGVMHRSFLLLAIAATPVALPSPTAAQQDADTGYAKTQAMVPMRDGVKLRVVILAPRAATPLPILLQRTPYNADGATGLARRAKALGLDGWYRSFPTLAALARTARADRWPSWHRFSEHPAYDSVWQARALPRYMGHATVPTLVVGGWWDQEDEYGPLAHYAALERTDTARLVHLVMGPWYHGQWSGDSGTALGNVRFGRATGVEYRELQSRWFAYWLKGDGDGRFPEAWLFDAGTDSWRTFDKWPPANAVRRRLYFHADGALSFDPPTAADASDDFTSDPAHPVPYRPRPVELTYSRTSRWRRWETEDQRFVDGRPDVLTWQTASLTADLTVAGDVVAHLYAATTGSDADWVAKLIDVYPDTVPGRPEMQGYELMVTGDIMRGRYRKSWEHPEAIPPNTIQPFTVDLHQQAYTFQKGHRIMVQVESSWFPLYDRNSESFMPTIFQAHAGDYKAQVHRVYRTAQYPSNMEIDVLTSP